MQYEEVSKGQWQEFCREFSRQHQGWLVTLEISGVEGEEAREAAVEQSFWGITAEDRDGKVSFSIVTGDLDDHYDHSIDNPTKLWVARSDSGEDYGLKIESDDDTTTTMEFRTPAFPEALDGVAESELYK